MLKLMILGITTAVLFSVQLVNAGPSPEAYPLAQSSYAGQVNPVLVQFNVYNGGSIIDFSAYSLRTSCFTRYYWPSGSQFPSTEAPVTGFVDLGVVGNGVHQYTATSTANLTGIDAGHFCNLTVLENGHKIQNTNNLVSN